MTDEIVEGNCPKCNVRLSLDEQDRASEWVDCPKCNLHFRVDKTKNPLTIKESQLLSVIVQYKCPHCENVSVDTDGFGLKGADCNNCGNYIEFSKIENKVNLEEYQREKSRLIEEAEAIKSKQATRSGRFVLGLIFIFFGILITSISYSTAPEGGEYTIFSGLIVVGIISIISSLFK